MSASDAKLALLEKARSFDVGALVKHPFVFAAGVGVANGLLVKMRGKSIDPILAIALASSIGLSETVIVAVERRHDPPGTTYDHSIPIVALMSVLGVAAGMAPFMTLNPEHGVIDPLKIKNPLKGNIGYDS